MSFYELKNFEIVHVCAVDQFVKAGEVLFEIDPRQYQADLEKAQNNLLLVQHRVESDQAQVDSARERLKEEQADRKTAQQYADRFQELVTSGAAAELDTIQYVNSLAAAAPDFTSS